MRPSLGDRLTHIIEAIESIQFLLSSAVAAGLATSCIHRMALERELEIIWKASRYVPGEIEGRELSIYWTRMTDLGNRLRHAYHGIQLDLLLHIAQSDCPPLKAFVDRVIAEERKT